MSLSLSDIITVKNCLISLSSQKGSFFCYQKNDSEFFVRIDSSFLYGLQIFLFFLSILKNNNISYSFYIISIYDYSISIFYGINNFSFWVFD